RERAGSDSRAARKLSCAAGASAPPARAGRAGANLAAVLPSRADMLSNLLAPPPSMVSVLAQIGIGASGAVGGPGHSRLVDMFLGTSVMGKAVFVLLALFSLASWTIMIGKFFQLQRSNRHTRKFLDIFRRSRKFSEVNAATSRHVASPMVGLFQAGYVEIDTQVKARREEESAGASRYRIKSLTAVERSLRRALAIELSL